jgi:hypothetical protein
MLTSETKNVFTLIVYTILLFFGTRLEGLVIHCLVIESKGFSGKVSAIVAGFITTLAAS